MLGFVRLPRPGRSVAACAPILASSGAGGAAAAIKLCIAGVPDPDVAGPAGAGEVASVGTRIGSLGGTGIGFGSTGTRVGSRGGTGIDVGGGVGFGGGGVGAGARLGTGFGGLGGAGGACLHGCGVLSKIESTLTPADLAISTTFPS